MPLLKRELHRNAKGPVMNDEDWWRLVFDTETGRLYVEHEWDHVDVRGGAADKGRGEVSVRAFLREPGQGPAHRELRRLLSGVFGDKLDA